MSRSSNGLYIGPIYDISFCFQKGDIISMLAVCVLVARLYFNFPISVDLYSRGPFQSKLISFYDQKVLAESFDINIFENK